MIPNSLFANPYTTGNWQALKARKTSIGDNKHMPGSSCSPQTNTPLLNQSVPNVPTAA